MTDFSPETVWKLMLTTQRLEAVMISNRPTGTENLGGDCFNLRFLGEIHY